MKKSYYYATLVGIFFLVWIILVVLLALILQAMSPFIFAYRMGEASASPELLLFSIGVVLFSRKWVYGLFSDDKGKKFPNKSAIICMVVGTMWFLFSYGSRIISWNAGKKAMELYTSQSGGRYGSSSPRHESVDDILAEYDDASESLVEEAIIDEETSMDEGERKLKAAESFLASSVEAANEDYPEEISPGFTMTGIRIEGDYVVYIVSCDEDLMDIDLLNEIKDVLKSEIGESIDSADPEMKLFLRMCVNAHKGIEHKYVGATSGKVCVVKYPYSELKDKITK